MLFNSLSFVVFFAIVLALHYAPLSWRTKKINLLIASYLFYAAWNPPFVILLWISTLVDWHVARWIFEADTQKKKRMFLVLSLVTNLGILGYFKYGEFLLQNWVSLMASVGVTYEVPEWSIILPVGISFYTFQTMAYSLDMYLGRARPAQSFLDFSLFVTFFPQLVAGPIVRPGHLIPQFATPHLATLKQFGWGLALVILGLFQKVIIADSFLAPAAEAVFEAEKQVSMLDAWLGTIAFAGQIFSDFAGYSTTAIGVALCLGFSLPTNFRFPYAAAGFSDFWRRWHISLSTWLRDYLYIPLGGNRIGHLRTYVNLMLTMLLGGLWHGASWNFVVWGGLHGLFLGIERFIRGRWENVAWAGHTGVQILMALLTFAAINITWVFFRARDFEVSSRMLQSMFGLAPTDAATPLPTLYIIEVVVIMTLLLCAHWRMRNNSLEEVVARIPAWLLTLMLSVMVLAIVISQGSNNAFIYFQF
ncbi:MBOAT family protein [Aliiglaciecola sp. CAU 1673]|uniref:MBOAT family O-acyltransferase n=1 Tax=Aliiglaciecola sp. CAU 1673 TaxID=3032595 RepID=UPI0023D9888D|nr:MBOAT family O-acyltransferase [Aliiglaciecola sp. CAU 1673]MDF2178869.1 MBOAT family protein [Aliiglaciecola sp. CAU 1673]